MSPTLHKYVQAGSANIFYREAGDASKPVVFLPHGFPTTSFQFRNLIPILAERYHVLAPDLPGFGLTTVPDDYVYTFEALARTVGNFLDALKVTEFAVYIFDYGSPVSLRLALQRPQAVKAIISQNGNAYEEGFGHPFWTPLEKLWQDNAPETRELIRENGLTREANLAQYTVGVPKQDLAKIEPLAATLDYLNMDTKRKQDVQLDLFYSYGSNVALYPEFQQFFRDSKVPILAVWGKGDEIFLPAGAEAFKRDGHDAEVHLLEGGHFLLETQLVKVSELILDFLQRRWK